LHRRGRCYGTFAKPPGKGATEKKRKAQVYTLENEHVEPKNKINGRLEDDFDLQLGDL